MPPLVRQMLATVAGLIVAGGTIMLVEAYGSRLYPSPPGVTPSNPAAFEAWVRTLPLSAFLLLLLGYGAGALLGSAVAARLAPSGPERQAKIIAVLVLAGSIMNLFALPHPAWFWVANIVLVIAAAWAGWKLGARPAA